MWSMVAHRLAERPAPTFDFNAHANGDVIMVPKVEHIQTLPGESTYGKSSTNCIPMHRKKTGLNLPR